MHFIAAACVAAALAVVAVSGALVETGSVPCEFPNAPQYLEPPVCPPTTLTRADATAIAWQFSPEMRFHNLEESYMLDPATYFRQSWLLLAPVVCAGVADVPSEVALSTSSTVGRALVSCSVDQPQLVCFTRQALCLEPALINDPDSVTSRHACSLHRSSSVIRDPNATHKATLHVRDADRTTGLFLHRSWLSSLLSPSLTQQQKDALILGDSFEQDVSTTNSTFTLSTEQGGNAWILTFHQFYAWNGCSNQALATRFGQQYDVLQYYMCPEGIHEGDWEHVGVFICPADLERPNATPRSSIRRVHYSQHAWIQEYDCSQDQCPFEEDANSESKLVAYVGLFSHANYPKASDLWVYSATKLGFLPNIDGLYVADRTRGTATEGRRWVPTAQNVRYIPPADEIPATSPDQWALYPGSWGAGNLFLDDTRTLICYYDNFTRTGECEEGSASFELLSGLLGAESVANTSAATSLAAEDAQADFGNRVLGAAQRTGPLQRDYSYTWLQERAAPIYEKLTDVNDTTALIRSDLVCPASREISSLEVLTEDFRSSKILPAVVGILVGTLGVALAVGLFLLLSVRFRQGTPAHDYLAERLRRLAISGRRCNGTALSKELEEQCVKESSKSFIAGWIVPVVSIVLFLLGVILIGIATTDLFNALDDVYSWEAWDGFFGLLVTILVLGIVIDIVLVVLLTRANPRKHMMCCACCMRGSSGTLKGALREHVTWNSVFAVIVALQLVLTVALFAFGFMLLIARSLLAEGCRTVQGLVNDILDSPPEDLATICLDLSPLGLSSVACGGDVVNFCNTWVEVRASFMLWGCYCILLSHLLMLQLLYQRGHTLGLLLGLERFEEKLDGLGDDTLAAGKDADADAPSIQEMTTKSRRKWQNVPST